MSCTAFANSPSLTAMAEEKEILDMLSAADAAELFDLLDDRVSISEFFDPDIDALLQGNGGEDDDNLDNDDMDSMLAYIPPLVAGDDGDIAEFSSILAASTLASASVSPSSAASTPAIESIEPHHASDTSEPSAGRAEGTSKKKSTFQRQKEELRALRASVTALETELRTLKDSKANQPSAGGQAPQPSGYALLWQGLAARQQKDRNRAEKENADLRKLLKEQTNLARSLERAMRKRLVRCLSLMCACVHDLVDR